MCTLSEKSSTPLSAPLSSGFAPTAKTEDEELFIRCRRAVLRLSANLLHAAEERSDFAPILLEAMHNAVSNLLEHGDERDLLLLEEWLDEDNDDASEDVK